ncbi:MAG TPA: HD-GYP domain-containing protein [Actinomycetota bacterium]
MPNPNRIRLYVSLAVATALVSFALTLSHDRHLDATSVLGFALLAFLTAQFPLRFQGGALYDISFVITFAAMVSGGPATAMLANIFATLSISRTERRRGIMRHAFNASQLVISASLPAWLYVALGGPLAQDWLGGATSVDGGQVSALIPAAMVALLGATALHFVLNTGLVSGAIAISERLPFLDVWRAYPALVGNYVAFALLGLLLGILQVRIGWASVLFLIIPLLVARQAFQAAVKMQGAYDETVKSLVKAIEAKDPYTRGHAERVSRLAEMTARAYGLPPNECRTLRYAALMHDVGKLGVESRVLQKSGKLTAEEYDHMKIHPVRGVEIVGEIDLLQIALTGVRHHHERMDGRGYPDGLRGDDIPLYARLIMVADAFDSMTSTRTYRQAKTIDEALTELRRCAGIQFDPSALAALERAIERHGWEPTPELPEEQPVYHPVPEVQLAESQAL